MDKHDNKYLLPIEKKYPQVKLFIGESPRELEAIMNDFLKELGEYDLNQVYFDLGSHHRENFRAFIVYRKREPIKEQKQVAQKSPYAAPKKKFKKV